MGLTKQELAFRQFLHRVGELVADAEDRSTAAIAHCRELITCAAPAHGRRGDVLFAKALITNLVAQQHTSWNYPTLRKSISKLNIPGFEAPHDSVIQNFVTEKGKYLAGFTESSVRFTNSVAELRACILGSADLNYVHAIRDGFLAEMRRVHRDWTPIVNQIANTRGIVADGTWRQYIDAIERAHKHGPIQFVIGIGTQAALALQRWLPELTGRQLLFLGVTSPIKAGLVTSLTPPHGKDVSGVAYCNGAIEIAGRLSQIFPKHKLVFVYMAGIPQDEHIAEELREHYPHIRIVCTTTAPTLANFEDKHAVYFSWFTLDHFFEHDDISQEILNQRIVVSTTLATAKSSAVALALGAHDSTIGCEGARMLLRAKSRGQSLRHERVIVPRLEASYNEPVLAKLGLRWNRARNALE